MGHDHSSRGTEGRGQSQGYGQGLSSKRGRWYLDPNGGQFSGIKISYRLRWQLNAGHCCYIVELSYVFH